jgi:lipopolysaccharide/colanic/teichoic acid biosynthesis glycosyltransferase
VLNNALHHNGSSRPESHVSGEALAFGILSEEFFTKMLWLERKRTERSGRRFLLMLLNTGRLLKAGNKQNPLPKIIGAITQTVRDTDLIGWYEDPAVIGVIFTEIDGSDDKRLVQSLSTKVIDALYNALEIPEVNEIRVTFHLFPEDWDDEHPDEPATSILQLALAQENGRNRLALAAKRAIDIVCSLGAITLCAPVFIAIAAAIKLTSKGPVLFRQVRLGQYGKKFTFFKFRSMYVDSDPAVHEEYVNRFIAGSAGTERVNGNQQKLFKLTADPRITAVGRFLRKTSLDELPQFLNVLKGEMSVVGPRPPITYEFKRYDRWHRRRLLAVKPGITGLWQVDGRSRVKFDEMVRLDIRYAKSWSLWLDIKILLRTPGAMISGNGAC